MKTHGLQLALCISAHDILWLTHTPGIARIGCSPGTHHGSCSLQILERFISCFITRSLKWRSILLSCICSIHLFKICVLFAGNQHRGWQEMHASNTSYGRKWGLLIHNHLRNIFLLLERCSVWPCKDYQVEVCTTFQVMAQEGIFSKSTVNIVAKIVSFHTHIHFQWTTFESHSLKSRHEGPNTFSIEHLHWCLLWDPPRWMFSTRIARIFHGVKFSQISWISLNSRKFYP